MKQSSDTRAENYDFFGDDDIQVFCFLFIAAYYISILLGFFNCCFVSQF